MVCIAGGNWVLLLGGGCPRSDRKIALYSENFDEAMEADLDNAEIHSTGKWPDYPLGVAWALKRAGYRLSGANVYIRGRSPLGAGLSHFGGCAQAERVCLWLNGPRAYPCPRKPVELGPRMS